MIFMSLTRTCVLATVSHMVTYSLQPCFLVDIPDPKNVQDLSCLKNSNSQVNLLSDRVMSYASMSMMFVFNW